MDEINLNGLLKRFLSKSILMFFIAAVIFAGLESYSYFYKAPLYKGETTILLISESSDETITQSDIQLNQKLVSTYRQIIKSRKVLDQVKEKLYLTYGTSELANKIDVTSVAETEIIKISVSDESGVVAATIANTVAEIFEKEVVEIYNIKNVAVIDEAITTSTPYNINVVKDSIEYAVIGFVVAFLIVAVVLYFDTSIKSVEDIENRLGLPVLGTVPKLKRKRGKKK